MTNFIWLDEYKIGNDIIDEQHRYLFDLANRIVAPYNDQQKTHQNVLSLYHYVREHFREEEALMRQFGYPGIDEQIKEHELLAKRLHEISAGILRGNIKKDDVMKFMRNWLLDHILGKDMLLGEFFRDKDPNVVNVAEMA
ncbi:MAG: bacteriohemerythrin [Gammaproteobacteria bacterium]